MATGRKHATVSDPSKESYLHWTHVNLRYSDTDRQGHINNVVFCTLLESGRCAFLFDGPESIAGPDKAFVIAKLTLDYLTEMNFPGIAEVGSRVLSIGSSSFTVAQAIFKDGECCCTANSVLVLVDPVTRRSTRLTEPVLQRLRQLGG